MTLHSGGATGTEAYFGKLSEKYGIEEINYTFEGHLIERKRGIRVLSEEELLKGDVNIDYVSKLMHRKYKETFFFKRILQTVFYQVFNANEVLVVGSITEHQTVKGGTGWGAELAKILNRKLFVFDQDRNFWVLWSGKYWQKIERPKITANNFCGTGTRYIQENAIKELDLLFKESFLT